MATLYLEIPKRGIPEAAHGTKIKKKGN